MGFPFVTRSRFDAQVAETDRQRRRAEKAEERGDTERDAKLIAARNFAEADAANKRLASRNTELARRLEAAEDRTPIVKAVAALAELRRERERTRSLEARLAEVQAANDAMCREQVTAAGTLTEIEVAW